MGLQLLNSDSPEELSSHGGKVTGAVYHVLCCGDWWKRIIRSAADALLFLQTGQNRGQFMYQGACADGTSE